MKKERQTQKMLRIIVIDRFFRMKTLCQLSWTHPEYTYLGVKCMPYYVKVLWK